MEAAPESDIPTPSDDHPGVVVLPPYAFGGALCLSALFQMIYPFSLGGGTGGIGFGLVFGAVGIALFLAAWSNYKTHGTNIRPNRPVTRMIESGPYKYSRNPVYIALLAVYVGLALLSGIGWMYVFLPTLWFYLRFYVIAQEEAYMMRRFGDAYAAYTRRVGRWM